LSSNVPAGWEAIAREIESALIDTGVDGFFTISVENPVYPDLYVQGTWNSDAQIWIEISPTEGASSEVGAKLSALGWNEPSDDVPNYWQELSWDVSSSSEISVVFVQAIRTFGVPAEDCELEASIETEK